jgi:chemotaxis protein CheD
VVQGEYFVSDDPEAVLITILGSCVAACLHDPVAGVGGMNHFLLPGTDARTDSGAGSGAGNAAGNFDRGDMRRFGTHAMELLINGLLKRGARRERLQAKLFGGARLIEGLCDVGAQNAAFAERFLRDEGLRLEGGSLRGTQARRVQYHPASGRARQALLSSDGRTVFDRERIRPAPPVPAPADVEFF